MYDSIVSRDSKNNSIEADWDAGNDLKRIKKEMTEN